MMKQLLSMKCVCFSYSHPFNAQCIFCFYLHLLIILFASEQLSLIQVVDQCLLNTSSRKNRRAQNITSQIFLFNERQSCSLHKAIHMHEVTGMARQPNVNSIGDVPHENNTAENRAVTNPIYIKQANDFTVSSPWVLRNS